MNVFDWIFRCDLRDFLRIIESTQVILPYFDGIQLLKLGKKVKTSNLLIICVSFANLALQFNIIADHDSRFFIGRVNVCAMRQRNHRLGHNVQTILAVQQQDALQEIGPWLQYGHLTNSIIEVDDAIVDRFAGDWIELIQQTVAGDRVLC